MKHGAKWGKMTVQKEDGTVVNEIWKNKKLISSSRVKWADEAYFGSGEPIQIGSMEGVTNFDKAGYTMIHSMANTGLMKTLEKQIENPTGLPQNEEDA